MAAVQFERLRVVVVTLLVLSLLVRVAESQFCGGQVTAPQFTMSSDQRVPYGTASAGAPVATVSFTLATPFPTPTVNAITVTFPVGFFVMTGNIPIVVCTGGSPAPTATVTMSSAAFLLSTTSAWDSAVKTCVFSNIATGAPTDGLSSCGISIMSIADSPSPSISAGALGGQVTDASMTLSSRIPLSTSNLIASFTIQTALRPGDAVTLNYPAGFITSSPQSIVGFPANVNVLAGSAILNVYTAVPAGACTVTLLGVALGPPMKSSATGFTVSSTRDRASPGSSSGSLGGAVSGVDLTLSSADSIAYATGRLMTLAFLTATALSSSHFITITWPAGYLQSTGSLGVNVVSGPAVFSLTTTSIGSASALIAVVGNAAAGSYTLMITGATFGGPTASSSCGVSVSTTYDLAGSGFSPAIGSQVTGVTWTILGSDRIPNAVKPITITFISASQLGPADAITVNYPVGFIQGSPQSVSGVPGFFWSSTGPSYFILSPATFIPASAISVTVTCMLGAPTAGSATGVSVSTTKNLVSVGVASGALGGRISAVSLAIAAADRVPFATAKSATVTFSSSTVLTLNQQVTIMWPLGYFTAVSGVVSSAFFVAVTSVGGGNGAILTVGNNGAVAGVQTVTLTGVTLGGPTSATCSGIWVQSSTDARSTGQGELPAIGGQISSVSLQIAASDRIPQKMTTVTISFTTQTALPTSSTVTIAFPQNAFVSGTPAIAGQTPSAAFTSVSQNSPNFILTVAASLPSASVVVALSGVTLGGASAERTFSVLSTSDRAGVGSFPAIGGRVTGVLMTMAKQDRVVAATGKAVTIAFTTQTLLSIASSVTLEYPFDFFAAGNTPTVIQAGSSFSSPVAASTQSSLILTAASTVAAGSHTLTLVGMATGSRTITDFVTANGCYQSGIRVSSSSDLPSEWAPAGELGGRVTGVSMAATNATITFTLATALPVGSVYVTFPYGLFDVISNSVSGGPLFETVYTNSGNMWIVKVAGSGPVAGVPYSLFFSGAKLRCMPATAAGLSVYTTRDLPSSGAPTPTCSGKITDPTLTIASADRITLSNRKMVVGFTTPAAYAAGIRITVSFPNGFVAAVQASSVAGIPASAAMNGASLVLLLTAALPAGAQTVTVCGVTFNSFSVNNLYGVSVRSDVDYSTECCETGVIGGNGFAGVVTGVQMIIPWDSRIAGSVSQSAIFTFTTATPMDFSGPSSCGLVGFVTISFPFNFFTQNQAISCGQTEPLPVTATGLAGWSLSNTFSNQRFVLSGSMLPNGTHTVTISGLTFGPATSGDDYGITIETSSDSRSSPAPSGPLSGYNVTSFSTQSCAADAQNPCTSAVISFLSKAGPLYPMGSTLEIRFSNYMPLTGNVNPVLVGGAVMIASLSSNSITLTLDPASSPFIPSNGVVTITLTGISLVSMGSWNPYANGFVSIGSGGIFSTPSYSAALQPTSIGKTITKDLVLDRPVSGATNVAATVSFVTSTPGASRIFVYFPVGFLIPTPIVTSCFGSFQEYQIIAWSPSTCSFSFYCYWNVQNDGSSYISIYVYGGVFPSGNSSLVIAGLTLRETPVESTNTFKVLTDLDTCTTPAATGAILGACAPGEFNPPATDVRNCQKCPAGTAASKSSTCAQGAAGTYSSQPGQLTCTPCPAGSFSGRVGLASASSCDLCAAGYFSVVAGATSGSVCSRCSPGTGSSAGASKCEICEPGTWSNAGYCFECPGSSYSLLAGSRSVDDCTGVFLRIGGTSTAYVTGLIILLIYIASFTMVPSWTAADTIMHFEFTADFEGRIKPGQAKSSRATAGSDRRDSWLELTKKRFSSAAQEVQEKEKRFFAIEDTLVWERGPSSVVIGTVESTSVYPEQDPDEIGDFVVFVKMDAEFMEAAAEGADFATLMSAAESKDKPVFGVASRVRGQSCRCQLQSAPSSHAYAPVFKFKLGRWELMRQLNACFQLLLLSIFPAIDTISDLLFVMSSVFANFWLFGLSLFFLTSQFWLYVLRLKKRRVFEAFAQRRVEMPFLRSLSWWPKWAQPDSIVVFAAIILPFYVMYWVVFPVVWFFVGYALYSFQLFPISRISNRWLYMFVYSFAKESDSKRRRFDSCNAIILPMVQKGKLEEALLESIPQMIIQITNTWLIGGAVPVLTYFSISLSILSLLNTVWYYGYWNIFRCSRIRDIPSDLALYNYKLSGVKDGALSFSKQSDDVAAMELNFMASVTVSGLNRDVSLSELASPASIDLEDDVDLPKRQHNPDAVVIELQMENLRLKDMVKQLQSKNDELSEQLALHTAGSKDNAPHTAISIAPSADSGSPAAADASSCDRSAAALQESPAPTPQVIELDAFVAAAPLVTVEDTPSSEVETSAANAGAIQAEGDLIPDGESAPPSSDCLSVAQENPEKPAPVSSALPARGGAEPAQSHIAETRGEVGVLTAEAAALRLQLAFRRRFARASRGALVLSQPQRQATVENNGDI